MSRAHAKFRHVLNEQEVMRFLEKYGFTCLHFEDITVAEQAQIFSSAKVVIAPHGSALTNLVFCQPDTKVIELFSPRWLRHTYWNISHKCHLDYYYVIGNHAENYVTSQNSLAWISESLKDDILVDIKKLAEVLRLAGIR
ncbi:glycosyltransferase family 61 protein [Brevibacillus thermoruber]|uniref:Glycosyltransferase family 61 protein n=1 Tax=Brevibacillus thermoruber TaxID=33942 RepID=A0A9X3TUS8_9BACL|nr:glycosyltransferase family 61 protein [Brevibacillus thermoruber]MDA5110859.1 glycosyltransferase family 61 protein [Brevibacillus thermoruber]